MCRAELHCVISPQGGLTRQRVHRLHPRETRDAIHGKAGDFFVQQALHQCGLFVGVDKRNEDRAFLHRADHIQCGRLHGEHHIGVADQHLAIVHKGDVLESCVGQLDRVCCSRLHLQLCAQFDQFGRNGWHQCHASFVWLGFLQNGDVDVHWALQLSRSLFDRSPQSLACAPAVSERWGILLKPNASSSAHHNQAGRDTYAGASPEAMRTSFLFTNCWMPMSPSSRP